MCDKYEKLVNWLVYAIGTNIAWVHPILSELLQARIQRGAGGPDPPPLEKHIDIGFLSNTGPDPLKNKSTKLAFNVGPSLAFQRNAI